MKNVVFKNYGLQLIFLFACFPSYGIDTIVYEGTSIISIGKKVHLLEDPSATYTIQDVLSSTSFTPSNSVVPNFGISESAFWLKFKIKNQSKEKLLLQIQHAIIDRADLYTVFPSGICTEVKLGELKPFSERKYKQPEYLFDLTANKNETITLFLRVQSGEQLLVPLQVGTHQTILEATNLKNLLSGIYYGIILIMLLYNMFIYISVKDINYLYYIIYVFFVGLTQACIQGYSFQYLWPDSPQIAIQSMYWVPSLVGIAALIFVKNFLNLKKNYTLGNKVLNGLIVIYLLSCVLSSFDFFNLSQSLIQLNAMTVSIYLLNVGIILHRKGYRPARFFLIAWTAFLISVCLYILKTFDLIPHNTFTYYILHIGSALETLLLSFALADRINILKEEKETAQAEELKQREEKQEILLQQADTLKYKVKEATTELRNKNNKLEIAYRRIEAAEVELIQKEKISALGLMAAGTSHEFNNANTSIQLAVDVITLNTDLQEKYTHKIDGILSQASNLEPQLTELETFKREIEYNSIHGDIKDAINKANKGLKKIAVNTKKLKDFSKIDNEGWVITNVNEDLINLSDLWKSNLGAIKLNLDLNEQVPRLNCNAQMINDCFKSVLQNSIESIKEKSTPNEVGEISIKTGLIAACIVISFEDNGTGMTKEVQERAFDMYFTTKGAQKTGTSLTVVKSTLIAHSGHIEIDSKINIGTTVSLIIPVENNNKDFKT